jgi:hypothetical protein
MHAACQNKFHINQLDMVLWRDGLDGQLPSKDAGLWHKLPIWGGEEGKGPAPAEGMIGMAESIADKAAYRGIRRRNRPSPFHEMLTNIHLF